MKGTEVISLLFFDVPHKNTPKNNREIKFPFKSTLFRTFSGGFLVVVGRKGLIGLCTESAKTDNIRNRKKNPKLLIDCALRRSHVHPYS